MSDEVKKSVDWERPIGLFIGMLSIACVISLLIESFDDHLAQYWLGFAVVRDAGAWRVASFVACVRLLLGLFISTVFK